LTDAFVADCTTFPKALSASDLDLVLYTCSLIEATKLFGLQPMPLSQCVVLSLVQQLGYDLTKSVTGKLVYLTEALAVVQLNDADVLRHLPPILSTIKANLEQQFTVLSTSSAAHLASRVYQQIGGLLNELQRK
jgi:enhancer of mRNA-decapping protein 4